MNKKHSKSGFKDEWLLNPNYKSKLKRNIKYSQIQFLQ